MRTRTEIEEETNGNLTYNNVSIKYNLQIVVEVLLDIRDLLAHPPIEISGDNV